MKLLKKVEVALLVSVLSCTNLVIAEELPEVSEIVEVNEPVQELVTEEIQAEELQEAIIHVEDIEQPTEILEEVQVEEVIEEVQMQDAYADSSEQKIKDFIQRIYKNCLGREAEENGLNYWVNQLSTKSKNASSVLAQFLCSEEFEKKGISDDDYIKILYTVCMDRVPDQGGINYWVGQLQNSNRKNILSGFVASDEFTKICNTYGIEKGSIQKDNASKDKVVNFVQRFYEKCLGRAGDEGGINYWVNGLKNGTFTGQDIAEKFMLSDEFKNKNLDNGSFIKVLYAVLMDRNADQGGLDYWVQLLADGTSKEDAIWGFVDSNEFTNICQQYGIVKKNTQKIQPSAAKDFVFINGTITKYRGKGGNVIIPSSINGEKVTTIGESAFSECTNITSLIIPSSVTKIERHGFSYCDNLVNLQLANSITQIDECAFWGCNKLESVVIPNGITVLEYGTFASCSNLSNVVLPEHLIKIQDVAFSGCIKLTNISIPAGVKRIMHDAFSDNSIISYKGTNNTFREFKLAGILNRYDSETSSNDFVFSNGEIVEYLGGGGKVIIPNLIDGEPVVKIGRQAFKCCDNITSVVIPEGVTEIGYEAFRECNNLSNVSIPNSVTDINTGAFNDCIKLKHIVLPNKITVIDKQVFQGCGLEEIVIPEGVVSIGYMAFNGCDIAKIVLPESLIEIDDDDAFAYCTKLTNVVIPKNVTRIGDGAFKGCYELKNISIPDGMKTIGEDAFYSCNKLKNISYKGNIYTSVNQFIRAFNKR